MASIFGRIDVDVTWMDPAGFTSAMPDEAADRRAFVASVLQVNFVSPAMHRKLGLREHRAGSATAGSRVARISFARVQRSAEQADADLGAMLGYVIAHEIGHLLLPANSHAVRGLMEEQVNPRLIAHNRLAFLPQHAALIRQELAARNALLETAANGRDPLGVEAEPVHTSDVAGVLDFDAPIHDHRQAALFGDTRAFLVDHCELAP